MSAALMTTTSVWLGSWLRGAAGSDDLLEAMALAAPDAPPVGSVLGAPPRALPDLLRAIRVSGADRTWLLLPRPGAIAYFDEDDMTEHADYYRQLLAAWESGGREAALQFMVGYKQQLLTREKLVD